MYMKLFYLLNIEKLLSRNKNRTQI